MIFARVPERGLVKTRIAADLGDDKTLAIYRAMLEDVLGSIGESSQETEVEILWTGSESITGDDLRAAFGNRRLERQSGPTLGDRLTVAFSERIVFSRAEKLIAIGADDPMLTRHDVERAFLLLDSCDWVIGPATDGGYYLIGCRDASFHASVFRDISWSGEQVFRETLERIREREPSVAILPRRSDIDRVGDLRRRSFSGKLGAVLREL